MKDASKKVEIPLLKEVVVLGEKTGNQQALPPVLTEIQLKALHQQIETIIEEQLQTVLKKATQEVMVDIKTYLDTVLPKIINTAQQTHKK
jgi:hypothetical protein